MGILVFLITGAQLTKSLQRRCIIPTDTQAFVVEHIITKGTLRSIQEHRLRDSCMYAFLCACFNVQGFRSRKCAEEHYTRHLPNRSEICNFTTVSQHVVATGPVCSRGKHGRLLSGCSSLSPRAAYAAGTYSSKQHMATVQSHLRRRNTKPRQRRIAVLFVTVVTCTFAHVHSWTHAPACACLRHQSGLGY
jgi:hypothetical protein